VYVYVYSRNYICIEELNKFDVCMYTYMTMYVFECVYICIYSRTYIYIHILEYICEYAYICIYSQTYI